MDIMNIEQYTCRHQQKVHSLSVATNKNFQLGKPTIWQTLIVSDPVQISHICYGKSPSAGQP